MMYSQKVYRDLCVRKGWLRTSDFLSSAASARHLRVSGSRHHDIEMITIYLNDPVATSLADSGSPRAQQTRDEGVQDVHCTLCSSSSRNRLPGR